MLTDQEIDNLCSEWLYVAPGRTYEEHRPFARAVESAATAPLLARIAELDETLRFVERWANHHGTKPNMTPDEVLSCIQHYPTIRAITHSYADGQMPDTPNPWKQIKELQDYVSSLERELEEARKDAERYRCLVRLFGVTKLPCLLEPVVGDYVADGKESLDAAIDAARAAIKEQE